jgi:hypothetical protein
MADVVARLKIGLIPRLILSLLLFVAFLDLQIAPEGFLHQPMGGTMPCLPQILEAGEGLTVKLDAHGCHIHRYLQGCKR